MTTKRVPGLRFLSAILALAALSIVLMGGARASMLQFSYTESGGNGIQFSFDQASTPTPLSHSSWVYGGYTQVAVTNWSGNIAPVSSVLWFPSWNGGMFALPGNGALSFPGVYGVNDQAAFTGTLAHPVFQPGQFDGYYSLSGNDCDLTKVHSTLTVTALTSTVPEPGSLGLFAAALALLGLVFLARRRARIS